MAGYEKNRIGNNVQYLRNSLKLDERVVSEHLEMDIDTYIACESGRQQFNIDQLAELSKLFNTRMSHLVELPLSEEMVAADLKNQYSDDEEEKTNQQLINAYQEYVQILYDEIEYIKNLMNR